jgi:hypothetical protein
VQTGQERRSIERGGLSRGVTERRRASTWSYARRLAFAALAVAVMLDGGLVSVQPVRAQQQRIILNVAPVMLAEPASKSAFPIQVGPQEVILKNSFVRIRGLPPAAALSEGHAISPGAWAVPLAGLLNLGIVLPVGLQGRWDVVVALVTIEGTVLTEAKTALVVGPAQLIAPQQPRQDQTSTNVASLGQPAAPMLPSPERERALGLHTKGKELLEQGNIQPARMLFRRAADAGLAESALALGGTYDPVELARLRVLGLQPDIAAARQWYDKARQLGAPEAVERLRRLEGR